MYSACKVSQFLLSTAPVHLLSFSLSLSPSLSLSLSLSLSPSLLLSCLSRSLTPFSSSLLSLSSLLHSLSLSPLFSMCHDMLKKSNGYTSSFPSLLADPVLPPGQEAAVVSLCIYQLLDLSLSWKTVPPFASSRCNSVIKSNFTVFMHWFQKECYSCYSNLLLPQDQRSLMFQHQLHLSPKPLPVLQKAVKCS